MHLLRKTGQLCVAVAFLHRNCVAHRDIKLDNLVIHEELGEVTLLGLGSAKTYEEPSLAIKEGGVGTDRWVAPEVQKWIEYEEGRRESRPSPYNPFHADIWGLGKVLHYLTFLMDRDSDSPPFIERVLLALSEWIQNARPSAETILAQHRWIEEQWKELSREQSVIEKGPASTTSI